jgi:multidrug efflux system membrane fusion protein
VHNAIVVPVTALRHGPAGDFVYVLGNDRTVTQRKVTQARSTSDSVAIATGLQLGERVITEGGDRLKDGAKVMLPGDAASGASGARGGQFGHRRQGGASAPEGEASGNVPGGASSRPHGRHASGATS